MHINYFNENPPTSGVDIDEVLEEIEYQLIGNKVSKLSYPSSGKVLVSTVDDAGVRSNPERHYQ